jgi:hypothetical protein
VPAFFVNKLEVRIDPVARQVREVVADDELEHAVLLDVAVELLAAHRLRVVEARRAVGELVVREAFGVELVGALARRIRSRRPS